MCLPPITAESLPPSFLYVHFTSAIFLTLKSTLRPQWDTKTSIWIPRMESPVPVCLLVFPPVCCSVAETAGHGVGVAQALSAL